MSSYKDLLSQAVVKGLGVTFGVMLGLVTVTPVLKYFYFESPSPKKQVEPKKQTKTLNTQTSFDPVEESKMYKNLFDDLQYTQT